jgi:hypothetical protein
LLSLPPAIVIKKLFFKCVMSGQPGDLFRTSFKTQLVCDNLFFI